MTTRPKEVSSAPDAGEPFVKIAADAFIGEAVFFAGSGIEVHSGSRIDAAAIIDRNVVIGRGSWVRTGAVVLRSVPANAIVEGNPAVVVGYRQSLLTGKLPEPKVIGTRDFASLERPSQVPLPVANCSVHVLTKMLDARGSLVAGEISSDLPFSPERFFVVFGVPSRELRGEHAHKKCHQFLVCVHGSCKVLLDDGQERCEILLDQADIGVYMPPMIWGTQYEYSSDAVLLVLASRPYEPEDYIRTYEEFERNLATEK